MQNLAPICDYSFSLRIIKLVLDNIVGSYIFTKILEAHKVVVPIWKIAIILILRSQD